MQEKMPNCFRGVILAAHAQDEFFAEENSLATKLRTAN
jgi:hypothetical protein